MKYFKRWIVRHKIIHSSITLRSTGDAINIHSMLMHLERLEKVVTLMAKGI